jgi:hypothetical protein
MSSVSTEKVCDISEDREQLNDSNWADQGVEVAVKITVRFVQTIRSFEPRESEGMMNLNTGTASNLDPGQEFKSADPNSGVRNCPPGFNPVSATPQATPPRPVGAHGKIN